MRPHRGPSRAAVANSLRRRLARTVADDALLRRAHTNDRGLQDERLLALHGARVRQPDGSAAGAAGRHHAGAAARAGGLREPVSRGADSRAAKLRAHAQHPARGAIRRRSRAAACVPAVAQRAAVAAVSRAHRIAGARRRRPAAVLSHRVRRDGDAGPGSDAALRGGARALAGLCRPHRRDESVDRAIGCADHAVGRRNRGRSRHLEADSADGRRRELALRRRGQLRALHSNDRRGRIPTDGRTGCEQLERNLSQHRPRAGQRANVHRPGQVGARARSVPDGLARRRRNALRGDVVSRALCRRFRVAGRRRRARSVRRRLSRRVLRRGRSDVTREA